MGNGNSTKKNPPPSRPNRVVQEEDELEIALALSLADMDMKYDKSNKEMKSSSSSSSVSTINPPITSTIKSIKTTAAIITTKPTNQINSPKKAEEVKVYGICPICLEENIILIKPTSTCTHAAYCCIDCIRNTIKEELEGKGQTRVTCPEKSCRQQFSADELLHHTRGATSDGHKGLFGRLDHMLMQTALRTMEEFRNCSNPRGCGSGQCTVGGLNASNFFDCHVCHFRTCINHRAPHHKGMTCAEYDMHIKEKDQQSDAWKAANCKKCPKCKVDIEKNQGCDAMTCCVYGTEQCNRNRRSSAGFCDHGGFCGQKFCWLCLGEDRPDGSKFHNKGCVYFGYT
jgi:hypothetical protein